MDNTTQNLNFFDTLATVRAQHPDNADRMIRRAYRFDKMETIMGQIMHGKDYMSQQGASYLWETPIMDLAPFGKSQPLTETEAQILCNSVRKAYGQKPDVTVTFDPTVSGAATSGERKTILGIQVPIKQKIRINPEEGYPCPWVVVHETCHSIMNSIGKPENNEHGPLFMRTLCDAAARFFDLDLGVLIKSAENVGLKVEPLLPSAIRKYGVFCE